MDSDGELPFSESENQPSPVPVRKLKRLRKATEKSVTKDLPSPSSSADSPPGHVVVNGGEAVVDRGETTNTGDFEALSPRSGGFKLDSGFEIEEVGRVAKRHLEFDSLSEEFDGKGGGRLDTEVEEGSEDLGKNDGLEKKWRNLGELDEVRASAKRNLGFDSFSEELDGKGGGRLDTEMEETEDLRLNEGLEKKRNLDVFDEVRATAERHLGFDSFSEEFDGKGEEKLDTEMEEVTEDLRLNEGLEKKRNLDGFEEVGGGAKRNLGFDEEIDGKGGDKLDTDVEESGDLRTNEGLEKKRKNLDGFEEKGEKKRKKRKVKNANDVYDDENLFSVVSPKKIGKKERRERLQELRAESQRLLRETREASFKLVPFVQKSVSSVLAKIRQRKQELSKKLVNMAVNSYTDGYDTISREAHKDADIDKEELTSIPVAAEISVEAEDVQGSKETSNQSDKNVISKMATPDDDLKQTFRAPVEDSQDLIFDSLESDSKDEIPSSPLEDVLAPSLTAMNLKFDSALPDDFSDDEDDNNKIIEEDNNKNIDPLRHCVADLTSSRKGDPVKAFVDDEAEEEDDSDDDRARFQDNEEDEDDTDSEELNDMIATAYEEQPVDNEMRNQLHQKWLEQQDAVGTENLLQRLKCDSKQRETAFMEKREDKGSEGEESEDEEFDNDPAEGLLPRNVVRMNLKKAKEMIHLMFTDKDDVYVSSEDDEETEKTLFKRHLSHKTEDQTTFLSLAENKSSKDIFGLIKKLNGVPDARRKAKIATYSNTLSLGGNKTASSKLSFLSRGFRNSLPSIQKHGSSAVRSFVFERDDSNSRSAILTVEDSSDTVQRENRPKKTVSAKFSNSQVKSSSQSTQKKPGPSLHEILRCPPPIQSSHRTSGNMAGQVEAIYAAFKLDQYPIKKEPGLSIRTA